MSDPKKLGPQYVILETCSDSFRAFSPIVASMGKPESRPLRAEEWRVKCSYPSMISCGGSFMLNPKAYS
jgi:hypothetical protein